MQYKIFCDDYILYDSQQSVFQLENPVLKQELNTANELTFTDKVLGNSSAFEQNSQAIMSQVPELYTKITENKQR